MAGFKLFCTSTFSEHGVHAALVHCRRMSFRRLHDAVTCICVSCGGCRRPKDASKVVKSSRRVVEVTCTDCDC